MAALVILTGSVALAFMLAVLKAFIREARPRARRREARKNDSLTIVMLKRYRGRDRAA